MNRLREKAALPLGRCSAPRGWAGLLARGLPYSLRLPIRPGSRFRVPGFGFFNSLNPQLETLNTKLETLVEDSGVSQISLPLTVAGQQRPGPAPTWVQDVTVFPVFRLHQTSGLETCVSSLTALGFLDRRSIL